MGPINTSSNNITSNSVYYVYGASGYDTPTQYGILITIMSTRSLNYGYTGVQFFVTTAGNIYNRTRYASGWDENWYKIEEGIPSFYKDYTSLAELKAALDAL